MNKKQSNHFKTLQRRKFLKQSALAGSGVALSGLPSLALPQVADEGYKALVCLFMEGGMDQNDTIMPMDAAAHAQLKATRPDMLSQYAALEGSRSREINNLLELEPIDESATQGRRYGMPTELTELHQLFNDEELAIVGGVGSLIEPVTRQQIDNKSVTLPPALGSHNDQQNYWQGLTAEGGNAGWGGQFMDALTAQGHVRDPRFAAISANGYNLFLAGEDTSVYSISSEGPTAIDALASSAAFGDTSRGRVLQEKLANYLLRDGSGAASVLKRDIQAMRADAMFANASFGDYFNDISPLATSFADDKYGQQLLSVARGIQTSMQLGLQRQIYFVSVAGFDTHSAQPDKIPDLQQSISTGIKSFRDAMVELQLWDNVTLFTAADFGRTMVENGAGTDHGWGSHHFVAGGSVRGKRIWGQLPDQNPEGENYTTARARLIPTMPIERYSDELGRWLGVNAGSRAAILPNLANFPSIPLELFNS